MKKLSIAFLALIAFAGSAEARTGSLAPNLSGALSPSTAKDLSGMNVTVDGTTDQLSDWLGALPTANISISEDRVVTGATDTVLTADGGRTVVYKSQDGTAVSLPSSTGTGFGQGFGTRLSNRGGTITVTPSGRVDEMASAFTIRQGDDCSIRSNTSFYSTSECPIYGYNPVYSTGDMAAADARLTIANTSTISCSYLNSTGGISWTASGACAGRVDYGKGIAIEPARSNYIRNSVATGITPPTVTLPTFWENDSPNGLTRTFVGTGTENGYPYVDIHLAGTASSTNSTLGLDSGSVAAQNEVWTLKFGVKLIAGTATGTSGVKALINEWNGSSFLTNGGSSDVALTSSYADVIYTRTLSNASTDKTIPSLRLSTTTSAAIDLTIRVYGLQFEKGTASIPYTSHIQTAGSVGTRNADTVSLSTPYWFSNATGTTCLDFTTKANTSGAYILSAAAQDRALLLMASATSIGSKDGTNAPNYALAVSTAGTQNKACVRYGSATSNLSLNGTIGTQGTFDNSFDITGFKLFSDYAGANNTYGWIKNFRHFNYKMGDTEFAGATN